jgi:hypothetical protein
VKNALTILILMVIAVLIWAIQETWDARKGRRK